MSVPPRSSLQSSPVVKMKFTLLALTLAAAMATKCSHTTCDMVQITPKTGLVGHDDEKVPPYMVMKITHSNEENKCHKHTDKHSTSSKITWQETGKGVHCKVVNSDACKMQDDGSHNCNCECHVLGTNGDLITPAQGNAHYITGYDTPHGDAQVYHSIEGVKEQLIRPQKSTNALDEDKSTHEATRITKREDTFKDTNNQ